MANTINHYCAYVVPADYTGDEQSTYKSPAIDQLRDATKGQFVLEKTEKRTVVGDGVEVHHTWKVAEELCQS